MNSFNSLINTIVAIVLMTAVSSCGRDEIKKEEKKHLVTPVIMKEKEEIRNPPQVEMTTIHAGESLALKFPTSWVKQAKRLKIPILDQNGNITQNYGQKVYSYLFPGDFIKEGKVYDKNGKIVNFKARLAWKNKHTR